METSAEREIGWVRVFKLEGAEDGARQTHTHSSQSVLSQSAIGLTDRD